MRKPKYMVLIALAAALSFSLVAGAAAQGATLQTKVKKNNKNGTATVAARVSTKGGVILRGRKVRTAARTVTGPRTVNLKVKVKGKVKKQLNRRGKVKVRVRVTYRPTNGTPAVPGTPPTPGPYNPYNPYNPYDPYIPGTPGTPATPNDPAIKKNLKITLKKKVRKGKKKNN